MRKPNLNSAVAKLPDEFRKVREGKVDEEDGKNKK